MSNEMLAEYEVRTPGRSHSLSALRAKKSCSTRRIIVRGAGHGQVHKMLARAIDELGIQNRTILVGPVGCSVFTYNYFDVGNISAAHGRAPAVATAAKRSRPESIVIGLSGRRGFVSDRRSRDYSCGQSRREYHDYFVNNAIYSMTGGQLAPTSLLGQKSVTSPFGRKADNEGYPLHMSEMLATLEAPVYIERVALGDNKQIALASRAIKRAVENQVKGLGFFHDRGAGALPYDLQDESGRRTALGGAMC